VVNFTPDASGQFTATTTGLAGGGAAGTALTFAGSISGNTLSGSISPIGAAFSATLDQPNGPSANIAGLYQSASLDTSGGTTYALVGSQNDVIVLTVTPTGAVQGSGTVANNTFSVGVAGSATVSGTIDPSTTTISGTVTTASGQTTSYSRIASSTLPTDRLINISSRGLVGPATGDLVAGFVVSGPDPKPILVRAVGPGLSAFGVSGVLAQPTIQLSDHTGAVIATNSGWGGGSALAELFSQVGAFALAPASADAALSLTLAPGAYTAQVGGSAGGSGVVLAEVYDASINPQSQIQRLVNISSLGWVGSGADALVGGFAVTGNFPKTVLIRGVGPALQGFGVQGTLAARC